jgi:dethiobiotin synthetase
MSVKKIIFVTGTDTGVGKTLLTALLLHHLRRSGVHALAMKPFCSGGTADVRLLQSLQRGELTDAEMNPFYFAQPIAPLVASTGKTPIRLGQVVDRVTQVQKKCDLLLIEGSGGLIVPLGRGFTVADLIAKLPCRVVVAARNRLGTINHTLLTIKALQSLGVRQKDLAVVLMSGQKADLSSRSNLKVISALLGPIPVLGLSFLGIRANTAEKVRKHGPKYQKTLSKILGLKPKR